MNLTTATSHWRNGFMDERATHTKDKECECATKRRKLRVPWAQSTPEERPRLKRVEDHLLEHFDVIRKQSAPPFSPQKEYFQRAWVSGLAFGLGLACVAFAFWSRPSLEREAQKKQTPQKATQVAPPPLTSIEKSTQVHIHWKVLQPVAAKGHVRGTVLEARIAPHQKGMIQKPKQWRLEVSHAAAFQLSFQPKQTRLALQQGKLQVQMSPQTKEALKIHTKQTLLSVTKGRFTIHQTKGWLRIEVQQGKVSIAAMALGQAPKSSYVLTAGHGLRLARLGQVQTRYKAPVHIQAGPARLLWFAAHAPGHLALETNDLLHTDTRGWRQRIAWLEQAARSLEGRHQLGEAMRIWLKLHEVSQKHKSMKEDKETFLGAACMAACRMKQDTSRRCLGLSKNYLEQYPSGAAHQTIFYLRAAYLWRLRPGSRPAIKVLKRFLKRYPKSPEAPKMRAALRYRK